MLKFVRRYFGRRRLAPVAGALPVWLSRSFGALDQYSLGQVKRGAAELKLDAISIPIAIAACCTPEEFQRGFPSSLPADYHAFRAQLTNLFDLRSQAFTCKDLRRLRDVPASVKSVNPPGDSTGGADGSFGSAD